MKELQANLKKVDVVLEVRDARVSSQQRMLPVFFEQLPNSPSSTCGNSQVPVSSVINIMEERLQQKRRIVALNKADIRYTAASEVRLLYEMEFENGISN